MIVSTFFILTKGFKPVKHKQLITNILHFNDGEKLDFMFYIKTAL